MGPQIPEVVILRLPLYARILATLEAQGVELVSSQALGNLLQATPAQIRKDLSYFGRFGKQGRGYNVSYLLGELRTVLGLDRQWTMVMVGVGHLGRAILSYGGFTPQGFRIVAAFDSNPEVVGTTVGGLTIQRIEELERTILEKKPDLGIVAVPASEGQGIVDIMVQYGIRAILNYAPFQARVTKEVWVRDIDPVVALQSMTYHLKSLLNKGTSAQAAKLVNPPKLPISPG